jgi:hypothetical protein
MPKAQRRKSIAGAAPVLDIFAVTCVTTGREIAVSEHKRHWRRAAGIGVDGLCGCFGVFPNKQGC